MTPLSAKTLLPNSILLIEDPGGGEIPVWVAGKLIASSGSCIAVGCRSETDGETEVLIGRAGDVDPGLLPAFDGTLPTPSRGLAVRSVLGDTVLEVPVRGDETRIRVWVNHSVEPDRVIIGIA